MLYVFLFIFFFNDTATTEIYTLSLHDALPIFRCQPALHDGTRRAGVVRSRRIFRPRRLWRSAPAVALARADGTGTRAGAALRAGGRAPVRLVLPAIVGRVSRHAYARLFTDCPVDR